MSTSRQVVDLTGKPKVQAEKTSSIPIIHIAIADTTTMSKPGFTICRVDIIILRGEDLLAVIALYLVLVVHCTDIMCLSIDHIGIL